MSDDEIYPGTPSWYEAEIARLEERVRQAEAVCDSYAKENQQFSDTIDRLRAALERAAWALDRIDTHLANLAQLDPADKWIECGEMVKNEAEFARKALAEGK